MHKNYCPSSASVFMKFKNFVQENVKICTGSNLRTSALQTPWLHPFYTILDLPPTTNNVNSGRPSSGCRGCFPLSAATTPGLRPGVALPPASPLSRVCPRRRGGSPSGDLSAPPALSLRGCGPKALDRPPSVGRMREGDFSPLAIPVGDEGEFTHVILLTLFAWSMRFVPTAFRPSGVARGFVWDPLIPGRDLNSMFPTDT